jgi:hypothetical protein
MQRPGSELSRVAIQVAAPHFGPARPAATKPVMNRPEKVWSEHAHIGRARNSALPAGRTLRSLHRHALGQVSRLVVAAWR